MTDEREDGEWVETRRRLVDAVRSGLVTGKEVMAELGISSGEWGGWVRADQILRSKAAVGGRPARSEPAFARVSLVGGRRREPRAVVRLRGGRRLVLEAGFDEGEVRRLIGLLESC